MDRKEIMKHPGDRIHSLVKEKYSSTAKEQSEEIIRAWNVRETAEKVVFSAYIQAVKP